MFGRAFNEARSEFSLTVWASVWDTLVTLKMCSTRRIVPEWKHVLPQLTKAVKEKEDGGADLDEDMLYLNAKPSIQFHYSCGPNYIHCLTAFTGQSGTTVVGFQWGHKMDHHQMKVWTHSVRGELSHYKSIPLKNYFKVEHLLFVPSQKVFVGACSDLSLRVFSDLGQDMRLEYRADVLGSVLCMHYCNQTEQLLTGSMGIITFWGFWTSSEVQLGITGVLDWNCCSLSRDTTVSALVTEQQTSTLYALCDCEIKSFQLKSKKELQSFHGQGQGTLRCISSDWVKHYLYTGDILGCVQVWSRDSMKLLQEFHAHSCCVSAVLLRPITQTLVTSSRDGWVKEWSCSGELLAKLFLDDPGGVRSLWLISEHQILCLSLSSFSVWQLQNIYQPFQGSGCGVQHLSRVECGLGWARILAISQDSIARIISPVSGDILFWTFLLQEHALAFAYNPGQEELFVACGTPEVLVLDLTLCPSPAKRILCTSENQDQDESAMSLEAVAMAGADWADTKPPPFLIFSGHRNGKLQLLSAPSRFQCQARKTHGGAVLQISSLPGPKAQLCCYGEDEQLSLWTVDIGVEQVELALVVRISSNSRLVLTQLTPGLIFAVSAGYSLLLYSPLDDQCLTLERNPPTAITCIDYCAALELVAVSGPAGILEVWDIRGLQLAEIQLGAPVSQVCFTNARGDLLACFSGSIFIIAGMRYLPVRLIKQVLAQAPDDDLLEDPVPFLPCAYSFYDLDRGPRISLKPEDETPETDISHTASTAKKIEVPDPDIHKKKTPPTREQQGPLSYASPAVHPAQEKASTTVEETELQSLDWDQHETSRLQQDVEPVAFGWPVAPDGFIPNSVIRNWGQTQEPKASKVRAGRVSEPVVELDFFTRPELKDEDKTLLTKIAQSQWLAKKPTIIELDPVTRAVMLTMDCMDASVYKNCTEALCSLYKTYGISLEMKKQLTFSLLRDIQVGNPPWKRQDGLKTLIKLDLLQEKDLPVIAEILNDQTQDLQQLAQDGGAQVYSVTTKETLQACLHNIEEAPARQMQPHMNVLHIQDELKDQVITKKRLKRQKLQLPEERPTPTRTLFRPDSWGSTADQKEDNCNSDLQRNYKDSTDIAETIPRSLPKPPHHARRKHSILKPVSHSAIEGLVDPTIIILYKKLKTQRLACRSSHGVAPPVPLDSRNTSTLVQLPPVTQLELLRLEPTTGQEDPSWRKSLYQLTSIFGCRSQKAKSKLATLCKLHTPEPQQERQSFTLPPVCACQLALGQRVVEKVDMKELGPSQFHHIVPLSWQLNIQTLDGVGQSQYGRLNVDWRGRPLERPGVKPPPIRSRMALCTATRGQC